MADLQVSTSPLVRAEPNPVPAPGRSGAPLEVAIVGGGVSGLYSAWKLLTERFKATRTNPLVTVFEAEDCVGDRLLSLTPPGISDMRAELGGMRIVSKVQPRIANLIEMLNREVSDSERIETYPFPVDEDDNILYLRGVHLRRSDFKNDPAKVPYRLSFQESKKQPDEIILNAIEQVVPGITKTGLRPEERRKMAQG